MQFIFTQGELDSIAYRIVQSMKETIKSSAPAPAAPVAADPAPVQEIVPAPAVAPVPASAPVPQPVQIVAQPASLNAVTYHGENGVRVDDIVPDGTPGTVTLVKTGHVLSVPMADKGEGFMGYCQRVYRQAGAQNSSAVGSLGMLSAGLFAPYGGFRADGSNWAVAADKFYNGVAYMTDTERATFNAAQPGWVDVSKQLGAKGDVAPVVLAPVAPAPAPVAPAPAPVAADPASQPNRTWHEKLTPEQKAANEKAITDERVRDANGLDRIFWLGRTPTKAERDIYMAHAGRVDVTTLVNVRGSAALTQADANAILALGGW